MVRAIRLLAAALALGAASVRAAPPEAVAEAPTGAAAPAAAAAGAAPDLRARPQVSTLSDLREYGVADRVVGERVDRLRTRRNAAIASFGGAFLSGIVGAVVTVARAGDRVDRAASSCPPGQVCRVEPDYGPTLVAGGVSLVLLGVGLALLPKRADVAETVALWNGRHPEAPLEMEQAARPEAAPPGDRPGPE